jgi:hypothetical protein
MNNIYRYRIIFQIKIFNNFLKSHQQLIQLHILKPNKLIKKVQQPNLQS